MMVQLYAIEVRNFSNTAVQKLFMSSTIGIVLAYSVNKY